MPKALRILRQSDAPIPQSPARDALAAQFQEIAEAERLEATARLPVRRLEAEIAAEARARAVVAELDARYATLMAEWAATAADTAPEPDLETRRAAEAALDSARMKADAARRALASVEQAAGAASRRLAEARAALRPRIAAVLREDGAGLVAEYWRRHADLEQVRRELAALDQVLIADFPTIHAPTGRTIIGYLSPDRLSAPEAMRAIDTAALALDGISDFAIYWRAKAADLGAGV